MKKITLLFTAIFALAFGATVNAQNGLTPNAGATHSYWVNSNADGSSQESGSGHTYSWELLRAGGTVADANDFQFIGANSGQDVVKVQIKWLAPAIADGDPYFLVVTESDGSCSNKKAIQIDPANGFGITLANADSDLSSIGESAQHCASDVILTLADANIVYTYGTTTLYYHIDASGINETEWSFNYSFTETGKDANSTVKVYQGATVANATTEIANYLTNGSIENIPGDEDVVIKVVIANGTSAEGTTDHNIELSLSQFSDGSNAPATINGVNVPGNTGSLDQTIKARPKTSSPIGHN